MSSPCQLLSHKAYYDYYAAAAAAAAIQCLARGEHSLMVHAVLNIGWKLRLNLYI